MPLRMENNIKKKISGNQSKLNVKLEIVEKWTKKKKWKTDAGQRMSKIL